MRDPQQERQRRQRQSRTAGHRAEIIDAAIWYVLALRTPRAKSLPAGRALAAALDAYMETTTGRVVVEMIAKQHGINLEAPKE